MMLLCWHRQCVFSDLGDTGMDFRRMIFFIVCRFVSRKRSTDRTEEMQRNLKILFLEVWTYRKKHPRVVVHIHGSKPYSRWTYGVFATEGVSDKLDDRVCSSKAAPWSAYPFSYRMKCIRVQTDEYTTEIRNWNNHQQIEKYTLGR